MTKFYVRLQNLLQRREGQGMTEYAVIIGLIALGLIGLVTAFGGEIGGLFSRMGTSLHNM